MLGGLVTDLCLCRAVVVVAYAVVAVVAGFAVVAVVDAAVVLDFVIFKISFRENSSRKRFLKCLMAR